MFFSKQSKIRQITERFLKKMEITPENILLEQKDSIFFIQIFAPDINLTREFFFDFQNLLKKIIKKQIPGVFIDIDINDYKEKSKKFFEEIALKLAEDAELSKKEQVTDFLSPFERKIIHTTLSDKKNISTQSIGAGFKKRMIIRPC